MDNRIVNKTKSHFLSVFSKTKTAYLFLPRHVAEVERWANKLLKSYTKADKEVVLLSVWLHDIGQCIGNEKDDHAVKSEKETFLFLPKLKLKPKKVNMVAHCVRAHRCKDVQPETMEAKILATADSASHMTDINYIVHMSSRPKKWILEKLERDYRDVGLSPKLKREMKPLYQAWKKLLTIFPSDFTK
ncbi:MAG: HD domain-containing protein [Candidatus Nealsonbacteria bacterium]